MKKYESSRGWRNNNPLNIRRGARWMGLELAETDREFCQFITMSYGYRAGVKVLNSYYNYFMQTGKQWRIDTILNRWAPPNENNTTKYIDRVLELTHRTWDNLRLAEPESKYGRLQMAMLMAAMTCVECGCPPEAVPVASINTGFVLAIGKDPMLDKEWYK